MYQLVLSKMNIYWINNDMHDLYKPHKVLYVHTCNGLFLKYYQNKILMKSLIKQHGIRKKFSL